MEDERLKVEGALHVDLKDDELKMRLECMSLAAEGVGSMLPAELLVYRASLIYNFVITGEVPEIATEPAKSYVN